MENNVGFASQSPAGAVVLDAPQKAQVRHARARSRKKALAPPLISIIIPAHDEQDYIRRTLEAARQQTFGRFEVIVVCNGCTDQTAEIAREWCDQVIVLPERGLSRARNLGARAARGKMLIFLDADTLLQSDALEIISEQFTREHAAGTLRGTPDLSRPGYRVMYFLKNFQHRFGLHEGSSGIILCWRDQFLRSGGFDEALHVTENSDLIRRLRLFGNYRFIGQTAVTTSMRRYENDGFSKMVRLWVKLWLRSWVSDLRHHKYEAVR
jgi:glycosyltransferase involved in cell wall biosynthesis